MFQKLYDKVILLVKATGLIIASAGFMPAKAATPVFNLGYDSGGDVLITLVTTDGTDTIRAGDGFYGNLGFAIPFGNIEAWLTLGFKFDFETYSNGDVDFTRFPLDAIVYSKGENWRVGGGLTFHLNPELSCNVTAVCSITTDFDNAAGLVWQLDYLLPTAPNSGQATLGARMTIISYTPSNGGAEFEGNSIGLNLGYSF